MKQLLTRKLFVFAFFAALMAFFLSPDIAEARRGGGGRSFGGRRFSSPRRATPPPSYRRSAPPAGGASRQQAARPRSSFGGKRMATSRDYTSKYGVPRKTSNFNRTGANGQNTNYRMHDYGGYGSGLMTGYMMGTTTWLWMMPFHPAFYYSRPYEVHNKDGSVDVYPPTFSWSKLFFTLFIIFVIVMIIRSVRNARRMARNEGSRGSFV